MNASPWVRRMATRNRMTALVILFVSIGFALLGETNAAAATLTVTKTADTADGVCDADCSLREAITAAAFGDTIQFSALFDTPQTITLAGSELVIDKNLTINGTGADKLTVSGNNLSRVFHVQEPVALSLSGMTITGGNGGIGGGIFNEGSLTVDRCHVTGNAAGSGGGIGSLLGSMTIRNSTISINTATSQGGGIWFQNNSGFAFSITNSTVSGNTASSVSAAGGGISVTSTVGGPNVVIWNCTITNNYPGGVYAAVQDPGADVVGSIIAANQNDSRYGDVDGLFTNSGNNLIGNIGTALGLIFSIKGDGIVQADPKLGPLTYNGGPTPTHALLPCSLAIDQGANAASLLTDQRGTGFSRTAGDGTDIGAFEAQTFTPTICNTGPPTIDATNVIVQQGTMGNCPTCPWFDIANVSDPDGLFGVGIIVFSPNPSNGVTLSNISMLSLGVFSAQITASCTASDADFTLHGGDGQFQASDTLNVTVTPETTPPVVVVRPISLSQNDHKYFALSTSAFVSATDNCDSSVNLLNAAVITQVTSDEPENAPGKSDGNTMNDIVIAPDCKSVQLRAERDGDRDGRVYTIAVRVRDASGNSTTATSKVTVPLSQNGNPAIESAPQYTVPSNCP